MALLEELSQDWALRFQKLGPDPVAHSFILLSADPEVELSATSLALRMSVCHHAFHQDDNELTK